MKTITVLVMALALAAPQQFQVVEATIDDIHAAMMSGKLTSHDLVRAYLDRIASPQLIVPL